MHLRVSAPGKTILMGEHAAVYQRPALVAAIDRRLFVDFQPISSESSKNMRAGIFLDLPQLAVREHVSWRELTLYAQERRELWQLYRQQPTPAAFARLLGEDPAHLVKAALGETIEDALGDRLPDATYQLRLDSQIPIGSGFGSSAALAVSAVMALLISLEEEAKAERVYRLAQEAERRQHGSPSGVDCTAVLQGGLIWVSRDEAGTLQTEPLVDAAGLLDGIRVYHTGNPRESTGTVVAAVRDRLERDPQRIKGVIDDLEQATREVRSLLQNANAESTSLLEPMRAFEAGLEALGVVPLRIQHLVRQVEAYGGAAKISGAGSLSDPGAGSLLVYHPNPDEISRWDFLDSLEALGVRLGAPGATFERPSERGLAEENT